MSSEQGLARKGILRGGDRGGRFRNIPAVGVVGKGCLQR